jgi:UDP-GlcNAc:undecaprenyl-phosphate/decaprenyl-phosphate GlcNAc-1-phosphate transferase
MIPLLLAGIASLSLSLIATPLIRALFNRLNLVDEPDKARKVHTHPVPRGGGLALAISYACSLALLYVFFPTGYPARMLMPMLAAAGIVFLIGLMDDIAGLSPWTKLIGQFLAAMLVSTLGVRIAFLGGVHLHPWLGIALTVLWLLACTNAINLIDGLDGLAAGVAFFACCSILAGALMSGNWGLAMVVVPLAGCLIGFWGYNFFPASIFLGDSGSLLIGFLLGTFSISWSGQLAGFPGMLAPTIALAVPLVDLVLTVGRRYVRRQAIFGADRKHIHHRLLDGGLAPKSAAMRLYAMCGISAVLSIALGLPYRYAGGVVLAVACLIAWIGIRELHYDEFDVAVRTISSGFFRLILQEQICMLDFETKLHAAQSMEERRLIIENMCGRLGFQLLELRLGEMYFVKPPGAMPMGGAWSVHITLPRSDYLLIDRMASRDQGVMLVQFVDVLRRDAFQKQLVLETPRRMSCARQLQDQLQNDPELTA